MARKGVKWRSQNLPTKTKSEYSAQSKTATANNTGLSIFLFR